MFCFCLFVSFFFLASLLYFCLKQIPWLFPSRLFLGSCKLFLLKTLLEIGAARLHGFPGIITSYCVSVNFCICSIHCITFLYLFMFEVNCQIKQINKNKNKKQKKKQQTIMLVGGRKYYNYVRRDENRPNCGFSCGKKKVVIR